MGLYAPTCPGRKKSLCSGGLQRGARQSMSSLRRHCRHCVHVVPACPRSVRSCFHPRDPCLHVPSEGSALFAPFGRNPSRARNLSDKRLLRNGETMSVAAAYPPARWRQVTAPALTRATFDTRRLLLRPSLRCSLAERVALFCLSPGGIQFRAPFFLNPFSIWIAPLSHADAV